MKVLQIIETADPGGAESVLVALAQGIRGSDESIGATLLEGWTSRTLRELGIPVNVMPLSRAFDFGWALRFAKFLREQRIDVVHAHEFAASCYATLGAALSRVPVVCTIHGKNYWPHRYYRRAAFRRVIGAAHRFVAVSEDLRSFTADVLGIDSARIQVIGNGVDGSKYFRDASRRAQVRRELGLADQDEVIIAVGELSPVKGHETLIRAVAALARERPLVRLLIAGEGGQRAKLLELARELDFTGRVQLLGFRRDVPALLAAADVYAMPSFSEGMPLALIEAMAARMPIVASRVGGIPALVSHGKSGLLTEAGDPVMLADALRALVTDPGERQRYAEQGHRAFLDHHSLQSMLDNYRAVYQSACAHTNRSVIA
jgi:glycosyltransferase involved in cell wall biosynthesis